MLLFPYVCNKLLRFFLCYAFYAISIFDNNYKSVCRQWVNKLILRFPKSRFFLLIIPMLGPHRMAKRMLIWKREKWCNQIFIKSEPSVNILLFITKILTKRYWCLLVYVYLIVRRHMYIVHWIISSIYTIYSRSIVNIPPVAIWIRLEKPYSYLIARAR
jgi:hypothetical protein